MGGWRRPRAPTVQLRSLLLAITERTSHRPFDFLRKPDYRCPNGFPPSGTDFRPSSRDFCIWSPSFAARSTAEWNGRSKGHSVTPIMAVGVIWETPGVASATSLLAFRSPFELFPSLSAQLEVILPVKWTGNSLTRGQFTCVRCNCPLLSNRPGEPVGTGPARLSRRSTGRRATSTTDRPGNLHQKFSPWERWRCCRGMGVRQLWI